jgi:hypothetical protein
MVQNTLLPSKQVADTITAVFPFQNQMQFGELINGAIVTATTYSGTDTNPGAILSGIPNYTSSGGLSVSQVLTAGISGNIYYLVCTVSTTLSNVFICDAYLAVINTADEF